MSNYNAELVEKVLRDAESPHNTTPLSFHIFPSEASYFSADQV